MPLGEIWIEESITPDGYFPISAQRVELTRDNTNSEPLTFRIENHKFVKLGMDSDWWEFPALCGGILGHVDIKTTMNIYVDSTEDARNADMVGFSNYLKEKAM